MNYKNRLWVLVLGIAVLIPVAVFAKGLTPEVKSLRQKINQQNPLDFALISHIHPHNPWSNSNVFKGEFHRIFRVDHPPPGSLPAQILARVNNPKNKKFHCSLVTIQPFKIIGFMERLEIHH